MAATKGPKEQWVSILGVPLRRIRPHFWTFSAASTLHLAFNIYANIAGRACQPWQDLPSAIVADTIPATLFWLVYSPILVEVVYMVFAAIFLDEKREESRQEGHQEGREEGREEGLEEGLTKGLEEGLTKGLEEGLTKGRQQGISEGRAQADLAWREWNLRRMEAAHNGVLFNDPPPDFTNGRSNEPA